MIDHLTLRVSDIEKTKRFYQACLSALGYECSFDGEYGAVRAVGFSKDGLDTYLTADRPVSGPIHVCYKAESKEQVDAFYAAGLEGGGRDNGAPGYRKGYHPNYYGAFLLDPDGNNIEAVFHG